MPDEQIERMLSEATQAFVISEVTRPFLTVQRFLKRVASDADAEEATAIAQVFTLAVDRWTETAKTVNSVAIVLIRSLRRDGLSHPPSVRAIAKRLALAPGAVEDALGLLVTRGLIEEVPQGFIRRRRRFRFVTLDLQVLTSTTLGAAVSTTNNGPATE